MRFTHRRCRHETEALAATAHRQTERADELADDLRAAEHAIDEVRDACQDLEYATTEAAIPAVLRDRLVDHQIIQTEQAETLERLDHLSDQVDRLTTERAQMVQALDRMLHTAHDQGRMARTYALMEGATLVLRAGVAAWLLQIQITGWTGFPDWPCQDPTCTRDVRELAWHPDAPEQAHLACGCGRVWLAGPGAVERAERATDACQVMGTSYRTSRRWSHMPGPLLEAIDRALPTPAQIRDREPVALPA